MRGIERLVAGALLVMAVMGTAVLARTSAPGGGHAQTLRLGTPPRSQGVAPLPVVIAVPETPPGLLAHLAKPPARRVPVFVQLLKPVELPAVTRSTPTPPAVSPPPPPPAAPAPAPTPAPSPPAATRVVAAAQPQVTTTTAKTFGHSHPRGHAWGHVKHAVTTVSVATSQGNDDAQGQEPSPAPDPPVTTPAPADNQASADDGNDNGNGNGHAYGHSKHGDGN